MNYMNIFYNDITSGNGFRTSLFVSGCAKKPHCRECWNKETWDFNAGNLFTNKQKEEILESLKKPFIRGLSILGGEPFNNLKDGTLIDLIKTVKAKFPNKEVFVWTGYLFENWIEDEHGKEALKYIDMLRDGEFIPELKNINQYLQGSSNQRIIDVQKTLNKGELIEYDNK